MALIVPLAATGAVVDRIAVVVGNTVITETEVLQEARLEAFLNQAPLELGPAQRKAAAERLVDQQLVKNEMAIGSYPQPTPAEADDMVRKFRQEHFGSIPQFRAALEKYGITEDQLKNYLTWQLAAIRFTDLRFGRATPADSNPQEANRTSPGADVDQQMEAWLKEARSTTKVQFKPGAFQ
jgi:parvulin-like peptidyl-prolyl isomerase